MESEKSVFKDKIEITIVPCSSSQDPLRLIMEHPASDLPVHTGYKSEPKTVSLTLTWTPTPT